MTSLYSYKIFSLSEVLLRQAVESVVQEKPQFIVIYDLYDMSIIREEKLQA